MAVDHPPPTAPVVVVAADEDTRTDDNNTAEAMTYCSAHEVPTATFVEDVTSISEATEITASRKENEAYQGENGQEVVRLLVTPSNTTMLQNGMSTLEDKRILNQEFELEREELRDSKGIRRCK